MKIQNIPQNRLLNGNAGTGVVNIENSSTLNVTESIFQAGSAHGNATLNIVGANTTANVKYFENANRGNGTVNVLDGATLTVSAGFFQAVEIGSTAELNISGPNTIVNMSYFENARRGNSTVTITNGAKVYISGSVLQSTEFIGRGVLNLIGNDTKLYAENFDNGSDGAAYLKITDGAQLITDDSFFQNHQSGVTFEISSDYLASQNLWAITGNIRDADLNNDGVAAVFLDGVIAIEMEHGHALDYNQTYNFMQIANELGILETDFDNYAEDDIVASQFDVHLHISYQGGDGNDIVFYTTRLNAPGDANGDGNIDSLDTALVVQHFGTSSNDGDANHDGKTDLQDLFVLRNNFGYTAPATIPEPTTAVLVSLGILGLIKRR